MRLINRTLASHLRKSSQHRPKKNDSLRQMIEYYSRFSPSPLSLRQFLDFAQKTGDEKTSFSWLRQELPTRLANMVKEMNRLPDELLVMPSTKLVTSWYNTSFEEVIDFDKNKTDAKNIERFHKVLQGIIQRHRNVVETMAHGIMEWKEKCGNDQSFHQTYQDKIQYFLDRFYTSRIGIRILINQHILLFGDSAVRHPNLYGTIDPNCDVPLVVEDAFTTAKFLCEQYYMGSPEVNVHVHNVSDKEKDSVTIIYAPSHLHHICFELFKNAMRATMERHPDVVDVPPINVWITKGGSDCSIKISDAGGGAARQMTTRWFEYLYSTAPRPPRSEDARVTPLAGYGYGLPISRLYARYLGGDLQVQSMEGYGTDAYIYLKSLSTAAVETVPVFNATTTEQYRRPMLTGDWVVPANQKHKQFMNPFNGKTCKH
uniref:Protein-serine/threonine kinase n=1 Tax=Ciona intestinalis TaxID=7719 RepID=A0A1W3JJB9_CIOIN|nr:pyruvate dehydrogenase (acetyl-transferring) kinase isozyme 2, mitochondrial [Ciona intestinalis]|eukprot:XP_002125792.1 pyruvate dehydrogenase (acetyl-transferring) kinase isozyme 2, mitochondrial [Ciona intestinalis]